MKRFAFTILAALLTGCAAHKGYLPPAQANAPATDRLCVTTAVDGKYGDETYTGSGKELSGRVLTILRDSRLGGSILVSASDEAEGIRQCGDKGFDYMLEPRVLHWEDRATQWSGLRDRISVDLALSRVSPYEVVRRGTFSANNSWFTLVNNPPEDLLDEDFASFVHQVVGLPVSKAK
jgi:hypothetical protein